MGTQRDPDPFIRDPGTLRTLADEAEQRHRTAFGRLTDETLIRAMVAALRAYANAQDGGDTVATRSNSPEDQGAAA